MIHITLTYPDRHKQKNIFISSDKIKVESCYNGLLIPEFTTVYKNTSEMRKRISDFIGGFYNDNVKCTVNNKVTNYRKILIQGELS